MNCLKVTDTTRFYNEETHKYQWNTVRTAEPATKQYASQRLTKIGNFQLNIEPSTARLTLRLICSWTPFHGVFNLLLIYCVNGSNKTWTLPTGQFTRPFLAFSDILRTLHSVIFGKFRISLPFSVCVSWIWRVTVQWTGHSHTLLQIVNPARTN